MAARSFAYNILSSEWVLIIGLFLTLLDTSFILVASHIGWCTISTQASCDIPCGELDEMGMRVHYSLQAIGYETIWIGPVMIFVALATRAWMTRKIAVKKEDYDRY